MALVFGAIVANRWFVRQRGLVTGIFSAASPTGSAIFLPSIAQLASGPGWRAAALVVTVATALLVPLVLLVLATARGSRHHALGAVAAHGSCSRGAGCGGLLGRAWAVRTLVESSRSRSSGSWWAPSGSAAGQTNGLIQTHLIPRGHHDHGIQPGTTGILGAHR